MRGNVQVRFGRGLSEKDGNVPRREPTSPFKRACVLFGIGEYLYGDEPAEPADAEARRRRHRRPTATAGASRGTSRATASASPTPAPSTAGSRTTATSASPRRSATARTYPYGSSTGHPSNRRRHPGNPGADGRRPMSEPYRVVKGFRDDGVRWTVYRAIVRSRRSPRGHRRGVRLALNADLEAAQSPPGNSPRPHRGRRPRGVAALRRTGERPQRRRVQRLDRGVAPRAVQASVAGDRRAARALAEFRGDVGMRDVAGRID